MYEVAAKVSFSAAHKLKGHKGACREIHGHNWTVEAVFRSVRLDKIGMVVDFHDVKTEMEKIAGLLDHKMINDVKKFGKGNPTAENIAKFFFAELSNKVKPAPALVKVWETDGCWASFEG